MSTGYNKPRGTKRGADSAPEGRNFKSHKPSGGGGGGNGNYKGGNSNYNKGGGNSNYKGKAPAYNKGGNNKQWGASKQHNNAPREAAEAPAARRKRPVTQGGGEEDAMSVDEDGGDYDEDDEMAGGAGTEGAGAEGGDAPEKRPKMSKEERAAMHAANPHRTSLLPSHALLTNTLLPLWETARQTEMPKEDRKKAIDELWEAVKGHALEISRGHKGGRILQTIVKYGGKEERLGVAMELEPQWREMMESKYSKFLMGKLIRYCPTIRPLLIPHITKSLPQLLFHAFAIDPISDFFDLYASAKERRMLVRGFYPREVALFDGGKETGDAIGLEGSLEATGEASRARVLEAVEKTVLDVFNATQKTALAQSMFHRLVAEYLTCIYRFLPAEAADAKMHELLAASLESLPEIVHTKDGSAVVRDLIVRGSAKDRKQILANLRKHVEAMSKDADAQLVLFTAFDCVDDTKLMGKAFVADIIALAPTLAFDKNGRRAILYLLTPTASRHFMPSTLTSLAASATQARELGTSKKDPAVRRAEILASASALLIAFVADKAAELVADPGAGLMVQEIMLSTTGDKTAAVTALAEPLTAPYAADGTHPLELAHATRTYKTLLSGGHFNASTKSIDVADAAMSAALAAAVWGAISSDDAGGASNAVKIAAAAPFVVVELLEALKRGEDKEALKAAKKVLGSADGKETIGASEMKGAAVLLERIAAL